MTAPDAMPRVLADPALMNARRRPIHRRHAKDTAFAWCCAGVAGLTVLLLMGIIAAILSQGIGGVTRTFLTAPPSPNTDEAGLFPAIMGSVWLLLMVAAFALPLGIATAVVLEEFPPRRRWAKRLSSLVQTNITNLAGVPSVVYGIIGLTAFASMFQLFGNERNPALEVGVRHFDQFFNEADRVLLVPIGDRDAGETLPSPGLTALTPDGRTVTVNVIDAGAPWPQDPDLAERTLRDYDVPGRIHDRAWWYARLPLGRGVLAGALTLTLVILPIVVIASQEALRAVPSSLRDAALGLGSTRWQTVRRVTLPSAVPGIMTGAILAMSRAIGEAAPLLMIAGIVFISNPPGNLMDDFTAMPLQIYNWAGRPQAEFHALAASGVVVLLTVLLGFNAVVVVIREKFQKPLS